MKKSNLKELRFIAIPLIILPFFISYAGNFIGNEIFWRTISISMILIGFPLMILYSIISKKYKNGWYFLYKGKEYCDVGRFVMFLVALLFLFGNKNFILDIFDITFSNSSIKTGMVTNVSHTPYTILMRGQSVYFEDESSDSYFSVYSLFWLHPGDKVEVKYLPRTKYIIETNKLN